MVQTGTPFLLRALLLLGVLIAELLLLTTRFDSASLNNNAQWWAAVLAISPDMLRGLLAFTAALLLIGSSRLAVWSRAFAEAAQSHRWYGWLVLHVLLIGLFAATTAQLFESPNAGTRWFAAWLALGGLALFAWLLCLAPGSYWWSFAIREKTAISLAAVIGVLAWGLGQLTQEFWRPLATATFWVSSQILAVFYPDIVRNESGAILGTPNFQVQIAPSCSGYEGIGLILLFTSVYFWLFRKDLRFPSALLLLPIGVLTIWLANAARITALIAIGSSFSEEIAMGGFHSQAGWIFFLAVSLGLMGLGHRVFARADGPAFATAAPSSGVAAGEASALLAPMLALLVAMLLTSAASAEFDWLYPVKVIVTSLVLGWFWQRYRTYDWTLSWQSLAIGTGVFVVWIVLAPIGHDGSSALQQQLQQQSPLVAGLWLFFRVIGSTVTVPLAEELAFRGYLMRKLVSSDFQRVAFGQLTWPAFIISSVAFGLMHGAWLAGTLAGMAYAYAVHRRGRITEAIYAHITTNALIAGYVLLFDQWWLW
jgi:exosortase E/protease (VPEID-CTERM system)